MFLSIISAIISAIISDISTSTGKNRTYCIYTIIYIHIYIYMYMYMYVFQYLMSCRLDRPRLRSTADVYKTSMSPGREIHRDPWAMKMTGVRKWGVVFRKKHSKESVISNFERANFLISVASGVLFTLTNLAQRALYSHVDPCWHPLTRSTSYTPGSAAIGSNRRCTFFKYGRCQMGSSCRHAHFESELRSHKVGCRTREPTENKEVPRLSKKGCV